MESMSQKEKGLMDMDNSVVIARGGRKDKGANGNGGNYNKIQFLNKASFLKV